MKAEISTFAKVIYRAKDTYFNYTEIHSLWQITNKTVSELVKEWISEWFELWSIRCFKL